MTRRVGFLVAGLLAGQCWITPAGATCIGLGCSCAIDASPIDFGAYNPVSSSHVDVAAVVRVTCGALVLGADISYEVRLGPGGSGDHLSRAMSSGANALAYNLYTDPGRTMVWGDGTGGTAMVSNSYLLTIVFEQTDEFTIYGRIPAGQSVAAGAYSDTIVATVAF